MVQQKSDEKKEAEKSPSELAGLSPLVVLAWRKMESRVRGSNSERKLVPSKTLLTSNSGQSDPRILTPTQHPDTTPSVISNAPTYAFPSLHSSRPTDKKAANRPAGKEADEPHLGMRYCWVPPGEILFNIPWPSGDTTGETASVETVRIENGFWLGKCPVTQAQWAKLLKETPSEFSPGGDKNPVEQVSWKDVEAFLVKLNSLGGDNFFCLPTEMEWEYACRAGATQKAPYNLDEIAWVKKNSSGRTHPVGTKKDNAWGLQDMIGNVCEWCESPTSELAYPPWQKPTAPEVPRVHIARGGSWDSFAKDCSYTSRRVFLNSDERSSTVGFRLLAIPRKPQ